MTSSNHRGLLNSQKATGDIEALIIPLPHNNLEEETTVKSLEKAKSPGIHISAELVQVTISASQRV